MRIGLQGLGARDATGAPWRSLVEALGDGAEVAGLDGGARCDAIIVCGEGAPSGAQVVLAFARAGGAVLGLGEGFQALCALGLLPGRATAPSDDDGGLAHAHVRVEGRATPFTSAIPAGRVMPLNGASAAGLRYDVGEPEALEARGQVIFRYCDAAGGPLSPSVSPHGGERESEGKARANRTRPTDPTQLRLSSVPLIPARIRARSIAGICGESGNVVGVLTAVSAIEGIGAQLLGSLRMHLRGKR